MPYNVNQATEQDTWNENFHFILLYGLLEHFSSDTNSIKESLCYMTKYILNKKVENNKANNVPDFKDIGEMS